VEGVFNLQGHNNREVLIAEELFGRALFHFFKNEKVTGGFGGQLFDLVGGNVGGGVEAVGNGGDGFVLAVGGKEDKAGAADVHGAGEFFEDLSSELVHGQSGAGDGAEVV